MRTDYASRVDALAPAMVRRRSPDAAAVRILPRSPGYSEGETSRRDPGVAGGFRRRTRARDRHLQRRRGCRRRRGAADRPLDQRSTGWQWAFVLTGAIGFFMAHVLAADVSHAERNPRCRRPGSRSSRAIPADPPRKTPGCLIPHRQASGVRDQRSAINPIWWFYLFWTPNSSATCTSSICPRSRCR